MKSLKRKEFKISGVKLFLEDLEKIVEIMSSNSKVVEIFDRDFKYDSIADLTKNRKKVRHLNLMVSSPYISFEYNSFRRDAKDDNFAGEFKLSASYDADVSFLKIREILEQKKGWFSFLASHLFFSIILTNLLILISASILDYFVADNIMIIIIILTVIYLPFLGAIGYLTSIDLEYSHRRQSFWAKNRDQILIAIIGAVIGVLATIAYGILTTPPK